MSRKVLKLHRIEAHIGIEFNGMGCLKYWKLSLSLPTLLT